MQCLLERMCRQSSVLNRIKKAAATAAIILPLSVRAIPYFADFENGRMTGISAKGKHAIPPRVLSERGNQFLRITSSLGDGASSTPVAGRIRTQASVTAARALPLVESNQNKIAYSFDFRYTGAGNGFSGITMQLFQNGKYTGYGKPGGYGPVVWSYRQNDNTVRISNHYDNNKVDSVSVGKVGNNTWHNIKIVAVWSHNPAKAFLEFYFDNKLVKRISGRDICKGPSSDSLPHMDIGAYGGDASNSLAGKSVDFDNIRVWNWSDAPPSTQGSKRLKSPTNLTVR